jgi:beta-N-acetylhexosaminidase
VNGTDLESRLGELMLVGLPGSELDEGSRSLLERIRPSGVILFAHNLPAAAAGATLAREIHALLGSADLPALVAADEEGGMVSQLASFWDVPPSARSVASSGGAPLVKDLAQRTARRLLALGVNLNFAPVLDVHSNPANPVIGIRSFGTTASQVAACGRACVEGHLAAGVIPAGKHFPGHGDTSLDSHVTLPRCDGRVEQFKLRELRPFEAAVAAGVPIVMTAHVLYPAFDPDPARPATISPAVVTGLLRETLGFTGVVVTDALEMAGVAALAPPGEIAVRAIEAGCDLLLYSKIEPGPALALEGIRDALRSGRLPRQRIEASLERLQRLRAGSAARPAPWTAGLEREARELISAEELERIAAGAVRILRQGAGGIPLRAPVDVLEVNRPPSRAPMAGLLAAHGLVAREHPADPAGWPARIEGSALLTIAARATLSEADEVVARAWLRRYPETISVASLNPHVADGWEEMRTLLATFDNTAASRRALALRLAGAGESHARGAGASGGKEKGRR